MKAVEHQPFKKPYEKPLVTPVRLRVDHNVLAGCFGTAANMTGSPYDECLYPPLVCLDTPTL